MPRIGLTTGRVGVNPGLFLTVFLVTVSEPDKMAGHRSYCERVRNGADATCIRYLLVWGIITSANKGHLSI